VPRHVRHETPSDLRCLDFIGNGFRPIVTDRKTTRRIRDRSVGAGHSEAAGQETGGRRVPQLFGKDRPHASVSMALPHLLWHRTFLIGRFVTLDAWSVSRASHPCTIDDHGRFCCFGSRRKSRWQSSRPCSANARPQTARRWATRRRPESREPLRPVAARQKPQATAGRRRELRSKLPARARCTSTCPRSL
jgi:hypothetical protein